MNKPYSKEGINMQTNGEHELGNNDPRIPNIYEQIHLARRRLLNSQSLVENARRAQVLLIDLLGTTKEETGDICFSQDVESVYERLQVIIEDEKTYQITLEEHIRDGIRTIKIYRGK